MTDDPRGRSYSLLKGAFCSVTGDPNISYHETINPCPICQCSVVADSVDIGMGAWFVAWCTNPRCDYGRRHVVLLSDHNEGKKEETN